MNDFKFTEKDTTHAPSVEEYQRQITEIKNYAKNLLKDLSESDFNKQPSTGGWSVGECFEHMNILGRGYVANLQKAVAEGRKKGLTGSGKVKYGFFAKKFISSMEPPYKMKLKTTSAMQTKDKNLSKEKVLAEFLKIQDEMLEILKSAQGLDFKKITAPSMFFRFFKMNVGEWLGSMASHERRHLWQASNVKKKLGS
ncbi:MAG: DinB family protein [Bacteroidota bacterium]